MALAVSLARSEMDLDRADRGTTANFGEGTQGATVTQPNDHFIARDGVVFAGTHVIIDMWDAHHLDDLARVEKALRDAVETARATLLHIHLHHFTEGGGISGVAVLAESHISVHTWPERNYAAFDVFMCGDADAMAAVPVLEQAFRPGRTDVNEIKRGIVT